MSRIDNKKKVSELLEALKKAIKNKNRAEFDWLSMQRFYVAQFYRDYKEAREFRDLLRIGYSKMPIENRGNDRFFKDTNND
jgi:hypothetical protein